MPGRLRGYAVGRWASTAALWGAACAALLSTAGCLAGGPAQPAEAGTVEPIDESPIDPEAPYPPAVVAAIERLAQELGLEPGTIAVVKYEPVDWPDGCLGLAAPDEFCTQVITPGWRVELRVEGRLRTFRTDAVGTALREESG